MVNYYYVGGYVRDSILGLKSKDVDFAVEAESYEEMHYDLVKQGSKIWQERPQYFTVRAWHPVHGNADFTLCRKDGFYSDGRHPDSVEKGTIHDDLARRDFTVNAIAWPANMYEATGTPIYIDPHNGLIDLKNMYLRCVGDAYERFKEDPLRLLRAVRFHIVRGFKLDNAIESMLQAGDTLTGNPPIIDELLNLPSERIYEEINKCFQHDSWGTLQFFRKHPYLEYTIFNKKGIRLSPNIVIE